MFQYVNSQLVHSLLLVGPEGAAIFLLLVLQARSIAIRSWRAFGLACLTGVAAMLTAIAVVFVGPTLLKHMGVSLASVRALGGLICLQTGGQIFGIDLLRPFRRQDTSEGVTEIEVTSVSETFEENSRRKERPSFRVRMRRLPTELAVVFVPLVFPTTVGTAYVTWLLGQSGGEHPVPASYLVVVIVLTMAMTLLAMFVAILIGSGLSSKVIDGLARFGSGVFILFGVDTLGGAIVSYLHMTT